MTTIRIVDLTEASPLDLVPPCADPAFDHRSCDYWEDPERGSKGARASWLRAAPALASTPRRPANPFALDAPEPVANPFARPSRAGAVVNPFALDDDEPIDNPFAPRPPARPRLGDDLPPKIRLLARGRAVFGSYAKVVLVDDEPTVYAQFGPLSAYPRALRLRELYPQLPDAPLPAVITCIATTAAVRGAGYARRLVAAVCDDLAGRGFAAVEAYPEAGAPMDATSSATPRFWEACGFVLAVADERFPVLRRELG